MSREKIAAYAEAVASIVEAEGHAERTADELFRVARAFESDEQLRTTLSDGTIPLERRQQVVEQLLGGRAQATTVQVVSFLVAMGRVRDLPAIVDAVARRVASGRDQHVAEVRSAIALTAEQEQRLLRRRPASRSTSRSSWIPPCWEDSSPRSATRSSTARCAPVSTS
jgi:F-type H+-transporting ATPase subunit delta